MGPDGREPTTFGRRPRAPVDRELHADPLPTYLTRFVGRQRELAELEAAAGSRLLTICGMGGLGKTRLAIEVAKRLRGSDGPGLDQDAVYWVPLGPVTDPDRVTAEVAGALGLTGPSGAQALLAVVNALRDRSALLILDNCEQVAAVCVEVVTMLLAECPAVSILTTSRIALGVPDERVYAVPPMAESADLFVDRARSVAPAYALTEHNTDPIVEICSRLDGLPLAIELAASWVRVVSPRDLLSGLGQTMEAPEPSGMVEDRHRSLTAVLDSTWQWLSDTDRSVVTALSAFRGGFTREAAEYVAQASLASLATLTERALIQRLPDAVGGSRYQFHELVRTYAVDRLEAGARAADAVRTRHFDYFMQLIERFDTPTYTLVDPRRDLPAVFERSNLETAMSWAIDRGDAPRALRMIAALDRFWIYSMPSPGHRAVLIRRALDIPWSDTSPEAERTRGEAHRQLGFVVVDADPDAARDRFRCARELFRSIGDATNQAASLSALASADYVAGDWLGFARNASSAIDRARAGGDVRSEAWTRLLTVLSRSVSGDLPGARADFAKALRIFESVHELAGIYRCHLWLSEALRRHDRMLESIDHLRTALDLQRTHAFTVDGADLLDSLALAAGALHRGEAAARLSGAASTWRAIYEEPIHIHHRDREQRLGQFRRRLGETAWDSAYAEGGRLTAEAAMEGASALIEELLEVLASHPAGLTDREVEVLRLVAEGLSNADIADRLVLSPRTVHAHLRSIFDKLGVTTRTAAAHEAVRLDLA